MKKRENETFMKIKNFHCDEKINLDFF
jgi:hypothetical protein